VRNPFTAVDEVVLPWLVGGLHRLIRSDVDPRPRPYRDVTEPSHRRRVVLLAVAIVGILVAASALLVGGRSSPADDTVGDVLRVGAVEGELVASYVDAARSELAALARSSTGETVALVSLARYTDPVALERTIDGVQPLRAYARVPLPGVQTRIESFPVTMVRADVPAAMARLAERRAADADADAKTGRRLRGNDPRERQLRAFYLENARIGAAEATEYRRRCACVYAVVVRATPSRLLELADRPDVRVVDAAPEVKRLDRTVFLPLLPEQTTVVAPSLEATPLPGFS